MVAKQTACVLVVEDEPLMREMVCDVLRNAGFAVSEACDAMAALDHIATAGPVDLVITDLRMPGPLDGVDLVKRLRSTEPRIPVIVTTGYHSMSAELGPVPVFEKPYSFQKLIAQVFSMIEAP
jgi:CheY-like chemotaxis protein